MKADSDTVLNLSLSRRTAAKATALSVANAAWGGAFLKNVLAASAQGADGGTLIIGKPYEATGLDPPR